MILLLNVRTFDRVLRDSYDAPLSNDINSKISLSQEMNLHSMKTRKHNEKLVVNGIDVLP